MDNFIQKNAMKKLLLMFLIIKLCPKLEKRRYRLSEESADTCVYPDNARSKMIQCSFVFRHFLFRLLLKAKKIKKYYNNNFIFNCFQTFFIWKTVYFLTKQYFI